MQLCITALFDPPHPEEAVTPTIKNSFPTLNIGSHIIFGRQAICSNGGQCLVNRSSFFIAIICRSIGEQLSYLPEK